MKIETRQRIEAYKRCIPGMKERVAAAGMMLVIAATMIISATFAWLTLSSSPEVTNINTTIAANGSLEIALVQGNGTVYPTSGRGDSSAVDNDLTRANITWGNLVNLSDASYGINNIALRPALLYTNDLQNSPLQGAAYGIDGRVTVLDTDYTFAKWNGTEFLASNEKGVRAISAYTLAVSEATTQAVKTGIARKKQDVSKAMTDVNNQYKENCMSSDNINGLKSVLSTVLSGKLHDKVDGTSGTAENTVISSTDLGKIYNLYNEFLKSMELQKEVFVNIGNFQRYLEALSNGDNEFDELTWEEIVSKKAKFNRASTTATSTDGTVMLTGLTQFISDYNQTVKDVAKLKELYEDSRDNGAEYTFSELEPMVYRLTDTSSLTANGKRIDQIGTSDATGLLNSPQVVLNGGYLQHFEQLAIMNPNRMNVTMTIPIKPKVTIVIISISQISNAHLETSARTTGVSCYSETDLSQASNQSVTLVPGEKVATDNYGLAIDVWVRTNTESTYLVLEGEPEKETTVVREQGTDENGNAVDLFTTTITTEEGKISVDIYRKNDKWYKNGSNEEIVISGTPQEKFAQVTSVVGYNGENRIWNGNDGQLLSLDSTTQGGGSCYIFYADTPEEQGKFLSLLGAFKVAFVSKSGDLLAEAVMDTDEAYAVNGKVTVPLKIKNPVVETVMEPVLDEVTGKPTGEEVQVNRQILDDDGNPIFGITELEKNKVEMITAIVYIDGTMLNNDDVLSASSIQGQLNLQFGSSTKLMPANDIDLKAEERIISAEIYDGNLITVNGRNEWFYEIDYSSADDLSVDITLTIEGDSPANVSAFFQRAINSTQGKRMATESFTRMPGEDNVWRMHYTFNAPGEYYLREALLDGVSHNLAEPIHVSITGFAPEHVFWSEASDNVTVYTASSSYSVDVGISFGGIVGQTDKVQMVFSGNNNNNNVSVKMSYDYMQARWVGKATFGVSSTYTLQYVIINSDYYDLAQYNSNFVKKLTLYMGLTANITTTSAQKDFFVAGQTFAKNVMVEIYDNAGIPMGELDDAVLTYSRGGSLTNTVTAPLTWDESYDAYIGILPITRPGSYTFLNILIGDNRITRALDSPTFTVRNPDPVSYNTASQSTYHGDDEDSIQFVPLTNDAYIGPIRIINSDTAYISAVVHNSVTNEDYEILQSTDSTKKGVIYYDSGSWYINLPTYRLANADGIFGDQIQDGEWTVKSISLWDVVDINGTEHTVSNKLVWEDGVDGYDFSRLSTIVSSTLKIVMNAGTTSLGSLSTPFMTKHRLASESGMYVSLSDDTGRPIPQSVISDVTLNINYSGNNDTIYGYKVSSEYRPSLYVKLNNKEPNGSKWTATVDPTLQYVGVYTVKNLIITMPNMTYTLNPGDNGVPTLYTVSSQGPESSVKYEVRQGDNSSLGKTNGVVTGMFMQKQTPDIRVITRVTYEDEQGVEQTAQYAIIENFGVQLHLAYKNGKTAPNGGGYTWSDSRFESFDLDLVKSETTTNGEVYKAGATTLLAGSYSVTGSILINGNSIPINYNFADLSVYSKSPTVKVKGVDPANNKEIEIFIPSTNNGNSGDYEWDKGTIVTVKNAYQDYFANVYMQATKSEVEGLNGVYCSAYTPPKVTLELSNIGSNFINAKFAVPKAALNDSTADYLFTSSTSRVTNSIGYSTEQKETVTNGCDDVIATYNVPHYAGEQTISTISIKGVDEAMYSVPLSNSVIIRETNEIPPSISFVTVPGFSITENVISSDGMPFTYVLPASIGTQTVEKTEAAGDDDWEQTSQETKKLTYVSSERCEEGDTGGCSPKPTYTYYHTYMKYERTTTVYKMTTITKTYEVVEHLVGWTIDGVDYAPGQTITVSGQMTATPKIGEKSRTLKSSETKDGTRTIISDVSKGSEEIKGSKTKQENKETARTSYSLPSGYTWFNNSNKYNPGNLYESTPSDITVWK